MNLLSYPEVQYCSSIGRPFTRAVSKPEDGGYVSKRGLAGLAKAEGLLEALSPISPAQLAQSKPHRAHESLSTWMHGPTFPRLIAGSWR